MSEKRPIGGCRPLGGPLCLDFVNTVHRRPAGPGDEYLHELDDFLVWAPLVGMMPPAAARRLGRRAGRQADALLAQLVELRELLHRIFRRLAQGRTPTAADLATFEARAREARVRQRLEFANGRVRWHTPLPERPGIDLGDPIIADAEALLAGDRLDRVKECDPEEGCGWLFLDTSRNRSRRWCSMDTCGSAAKARAWYRRQSGG